MIKYEVDKDDDDVIGDDEVMMSLNKIILILQHFIVIHSYATRCISKILQLRLW